MNMKAIRVSEYGGADVLQYEEVPTPQPRAGEALVRLEAIGVNFIDIYQRSGQYKVPLPMTPGSEGAGVVEAVGEGVGEVAVGERVAYAMQQGAYAEYAVVPVLKLVPLPNDVSSEVATAVMLQGMTAHYLTHSTFPIRNGQHVLIHAAAGGVGLLLVQLAKRRGGYGLGTGSTKTQAEQARQAGVAAPLPLTPPGFGAYV